MNFHHVLGPCCQIALQLAAVLTLGSVCSAAECFSIEEARKHVGQMACVTGKVLKVGKGRSTWYLDFCEDYKECPFTVVVFERDLKDTEKLQAFAGHTIRIYGPIKEYEGHAEIILKMEQQLSGEGGTYTEKLKDKPHRDRMAPVPRGAGMGRRRAW